MRLLNLNTVAGEEEGSRSPTEWAFPPGGAAARLSPQVRPKFRFAEFRVWPEAKRVFAKVRTCAGLLHDRGFAVSKATAEKSESKARSGFEREKPLPSFPKGKANSGLSFKSDRFLRSKNRAWSVRTWLGNKNLFSQNGGHAPPFCTIAFLR